MENKYYTPSICEMNAEFWYEEAKRIDKLHKNKYKYECIYVAILIVTGISILVLMFSL